MKEGWTYKKLGEVAMLKNGFAFKSSLFKETGTPIVRISNIQDDRITTDFVYFDKNDYRETLDKYEVYEGDILIAMSGATTGKVGINTNSEVLYLNQRVGKFVPQKELHSLFLFYYLKRNANFSLSVAQGMAQPNLSTQQINNFIIPIPPLAEQERIVAELDLLSSIIDKKKAQLKELDQLAQSIFYDMFGTTIEEKGWEVKKMGEIGTFQRGGGFLKSDFVENGVPCIHYGQIHMKFGPFLYQHLTEIPKEVAAKSKIASKGDVIIAITSEDVEGSCKCTAWLGDYDVYVGAHAAIFKHSLNPIYVSYYIGASEFQREKQKYVHGIKVMEIKPSDIEKINILLPPLPLQKEFASKVEAIERQKSLIQQSIVEVQTMFDGRMDYWFG